MIQINFIYIDLGHTQIPRLKTVWKALTKKRSLAKTKKSRELKVKTENDCPYCGKGENTLDIPLPETTHTPYSETKSRRGRKKRYTPINFVPVLIAITISSPTRNSTHQNVPDFSGTF
jgi:hypothetical protein